MIFPSTTYNPNPTHCKERENGWTSLLFFEKKKKKYYYCISIIGITFPIQRKDTFKRRINEAP